MASAKKHHYVPQFLLRRFATEDEQITTVRLPGQKRYTSSVVDTGSENRFHTIPQNTANPEALEDAFGELEDSAAPVLVKMEDGTWPLSQGDRITLGAFVTLQALRGPEQRRLMLSLQVAMVEREKQRVEEEGAAKWFARYGVHLTEERAREAWDSAVGAGEPLVTIDAAYHAEQIAVHAETVLPDVLGRVWTLVRFNKPTLFTSDAPVSLDGVSDERGSWGLLNAPSLSLPLGRTLGLVLGPTYPCESQADADALLNGTFDQLVIDNAAWAERLNARTIHNSSRALFHHPDDTALLPEELPDPRD